MEQIELAAINKFTFSYLNKFRKIQILLENNKDGVIVFDKVLILYCFALAKKMKNSFPAACGSRRSNVCALSDFRVKFAKVFSNQIQSKQKWNEFCPKYQNTKKLHSFPNIKKCQNIKIPKNLAQTSFNFCFGCISLLRLIVDLIFLQMTQVSVSSFGSPSGA